MTFPAFVNLTLNRVSTSAEEITFRDLFKGKEEEEITVSANMVSANEIAADSTAQNVGADTADVETEAAVAAVDSADTESAAAEADAEEKKDYSNGRRDVWKLYMENLNMEGHPTMQPDKTIAHAHNTYLQSAYDHGILFGIVFLIFCILSGCKSVHYYIIRKKMNMQHFRLLSC